MSVSNPLFKMIVFAAIVPPVANYDYSNFVKISITYSGTLLEKNKAQCPLSNSPIRKELGK